MQAAMNRFQEWLDDVGNVFKETEDKPEDRALLISALFLSGADALTIQEAARELLNEKPRDSVRDILSGPDLATRLKDVKARVVGRKADFDHRPGYARAVLLHLWHQRADIHDHLLTWLDGIVAKESDVGRLTAISDLLVELAIAENDIRVIDKFKKWIDASDKEEHLQLVAGILVRAAEADALGPAVRSKLLKWAQDPSESVARAVAMACTGGFASRYRRQALVRLKHILGRAERDRAVESAEKALRTMAAGEGQLVEVWRAVNRWATAKKEDNDGGHRAFLSLLDPHDDPYILQVMLHAAHQDKEVETALVNGWSAALDNTRVHRECRDLINGWAQARADGLVFREQVTGIFNRVIERHLLTTPISALLFGDSTVRDAAAVIELRKDLVLPAQLRRFQDSSSPTES